MIRALVIGAALIVAIVVGASLVAGDLRVQPPPTDTLVPTPTFATVHLTAAQVAHDMQTDHFYADYGQSTLLIQGVVVAVNGPGQSQIVDLATDGPGPVRCDVGSHPTSVKVGDSITVQVADPRRDVTRDGTAVLIRNCAIG